MAESAGPTMHTEVHRPERTIRDLPISLTRWMTAASSQVFIDVRSSRCPSGNAPVISSNMGPEKLLSATVVRMVETPNSAAAFATSAALLRSMTASIDLVANDICDWKSIMIRMWSLGSRRPAPGADVAVGIVSLLGGVGFRLGHLLAMGARAWSGLGSHRLKPFSCRLS